jgi:hypothetical protein
LAHTVRRSTRKKASTSAVATVREELEEVSVEVAKPAMIADAATTEMNAAVVALAAPNAQDAAPNAQDAAADRGGAAHAMADSKAVAASAALA